MPVRSRSQSTVIRSDDGAAVVVRLADDITECPTCRRPNEVLRRLDDIARVLRRRELRGTPHVHRLIATTDAAQPAASPCPAPAGDGRKEPERL